ncbi:MAG: 23S rRNA (guanosine(2251)-2'-O)-methyltransferase RlmB [Candidatus Yonathbacteria bacterium]|nr:23S rRNA (guanosine(2251)-2'-O)-methyltransferase RlmB [Candidatus Yonathbacteria bacterium]
MAQNKIYIYGKHAVEEALQGKPHAVGKVLVSKQEVGSALEALIKKTGVLVEKFSDATRPSYIDREVAHQGVIAQISVDKLVIPYKDFVEKLTVTPDTALALLGEIQDPQNVGAIIRSAAAFGISGVLIPEHNQASVSGAVIKASSGMAFRVPLVSIGNVNTTLRDLKEKKFWVYGLDETAAKNLSQEIFDAPTLFVLGNEALGIREKTREMCDILLSISMHSQCESLNVASSATVAFYAWSRGHANALK